MQWDDYNKYSFDTVHKTLVEYERRFNDHTSWLKLLYNYEEIFSKVHD